MLYHAGVKAFRYAIDGQALRIKATVADATEARYHAIHAGHRQAAFPVLFFLGSQCLDRRVDENCLRYGRRIRIPLVALEAHDHDCQVHADLRRGEADAFGGCHRLEHVPDQCIEIRAVESKHGFRDAEQARVAHFQNFMDGHGQDECSQVIMSARIVCHRV